MRISFEQPKNGWVVLSITDRNYHLTDTISDVPNDFVHDLMVAISRLLSYEDKQHVKLSLEPSYYVITLLREGEIFSFAIAAKGFKNDKVLHRACGKLEEIILPIFRAIKGFYNSRKDDRHWSGCNHQEFDRFLMAVAEHSRDA